MKTQGRYNVKYLKFIRQLPCMICDSSGYLDPWTFQDGVVKSEPDHLPVTGLKGIGMKSPDAFTVPVCRKHHNERALHFRRPGMIFDYATVYGKGIDLRWVDVNLYEVVARLLWAYYNQGEK